ncbi:hypothetical protein [Halovivax asiaticus]|uniref:hypothetical protein n=1 Tax=Halovivax asiaticus TaxID=332953 RepID=UPI0006778C71|nr:hypothetical protein [Halovivax asiaticus]
MSDREHTWVVLLVAGMTFTVVGLTLLGSTVWYLQYGALLAGLVLAALSVYQQVAETTPT